MFQVRIGDISQSLYVHSRSNETHAVKRLLLLSLLVPLVALSAYGQTVSCPAAKPRQNQYRGDVKHRAPGDPKGSIIGANDIYGWPNVTVAMAGKFRRVAS